MQDPRSLQRRRHSGRSVKIAAAFDRVKMRTDHYHRRVCLLAFPSADQIAGGVFIYTQTTFLHLLSQVTPRRPVLCSQGKPGQSLPRSRIMFCQFLNIALNPRPVCPHQRFLLRTLPPDPFDYLSEQKAGQRKTFCKFSHRPASFIDEMPYSRTGAPGPSGRFRANQTNS